MFGERLKKLRDHCGMSQRELAEAAGFTIRRIEDWEQSKSEPRWSDLLKLAEALGVELADFRQDPNQQA